MSEIPWVSVIVPVYNARRYLKRCVRSLQNQTERNIEIILVDDGSTDGSGKLCDRFAARDSRIAVCHQKNGGVSAARNRGLELARGKYIMFCDSDDTVLPRYCQAHLEAMAQPGVGLTMAYTFSLPRGVPPLPAGELYRPDYSQLLRLWKDRWLWYCWGKCFEREIIRRKGLRFPGNIKHGEDTVFVVEYIMELMDRPGRICLWQEELYRYFDTPGSLAKDLTAMGASMDLKWETARKLDGLVGFPPEELEDFLAEDWVWVENNALRARLWDCRWSRMDQVRDVLSDPDFRRMLFEDRRLNVFGSRYRKVLNSGSTLLIFGYFSLWKKKTQILRGPLARLRPQKISQ